MVEPAIDLQAVRRARKPRSDYDPGKAEIRARHAQAKAMHASAAAQERLATVIENAVKDLKPAADAIHRLADAQKKLCDFIVNNRLKIVLGVPGFLGGVAVVVNAVSPSAAETLGAFLKGLGGLG